MAVCLFQPKDQPRWDEFVKHSPEATLYHQIGWKEVIEKSFGQRGYYWLAEDPTGKIIGILPVVHLKSLLFGSFMVSLPYFNYGGVCAQEDGTCMELMDAAIEEAKRAGAAHIEFRHQMPIETDLPVKTAKVSMRLELPASADVLFQSFDAKLRSQIRRPTKEGMEATIGGVEALDSFYDVFSKNMRDLGTPVYSKSFFKNIMDVFPGISWICTVYKEGVPVASGFLLGFKETLEIPWASSLSEYNRFSPNMLLYWTVLKFACERGFKTFDFGRSTEGEGTYRFKAQWGAKPVPLYWHYWIGKEGKLPELNPKNPKYSAAINLWKKLPVGLTKMIGPLIVRNLP
ncbi:MAG: FemAB family PEP-CTERM system-associated protein [Nitrospirae bacterium]|nr:FemAB family PEP-CTERM system-associated protein [Candidatus Manganitrophaceae bacterium]